MRAKYGGVREAATDDAVISNGVLNLAPDKRRAFSLVLRVPRPGGWFLYADIVVDAELPESVRRDIDLWSGRIGGALREAEILSLLAELGGGRDPRGFDPSLGTSKDGADEAFLCVAFVQEKGLYLGSNHARARASVGVPRLLARAYFPPERSGRLWDFLGDDLPSVAVPRAGEGEELSERALEEHLEQHWTEGGSSSSSAGGRPIAWWARSAGTSDGSARNAAGIAGRPSAPSSCARPIPSSVMP